MSPSVLSRVVIASCLLGLCLSRCGVVDGQAWQGWSVFALVPGPSALAVDASGSVLVSDLVENVVLRLNGSGHVVQRYGPPRPDLQEPEGLAVDDDGCVYILWTCGLSVVKLAANGSQLALYDLRSSSMAQPWGLAVDAAGVMYIGDRHKQALYVLSSSGQQQAVYSVGLSGPLAVSSSGLVHAAGACDDGWGCVTKMTGSARPLLTFGTSSAPLAVGGVAVDGSGSLYVTDSEHNRAVRLGAHGNLLRSFSTPGPGLSSPRGIAVDKLGNVYIADLGNSRVLKFAAPARIVSSSSSTAAASAQHVADAAIAAKR